MYKLSVDIGVRQTDKQTDIVKRPLLRAAY